MSIYSYKNSIKATVWNKKYGLNIAHAYAKYYNFGDNALAFGVKNIFQTFWSHNIRFMDYDVHSTIFDQRKINEINQHADLFIVGGGGLIHTFNSKFWLFNMDDSDIDLLKVPIAFFGLGYNNFSADGLHKDSIQNIINLYNKSISFTVRNDGSKERLQSLGLNFAEIPDPGFFVDSNFPIPVISKNYVIVQLAFDAADERKSNSDFFFTEILKICKTLLMKGYDIVFTPHCFLDIDISYRLKQALHNSSVYIWNWYKIIREDNVLEGLGYYKNAKFVIAMRGHAQICPIGMNIPVISLINHPKHLGLLRKLDLDFYTANICNKNFSDRVIMLIEYLEKNRLELVEKYMQINKKFYTEMQTYIKTLVDSYDKIKYQRSSYNVKDYSDLSLSNKLLFLLYKRLERVLRTKQIIV